MSSGRIQPDTIVPHVLVQLVTTAPVDRSKAPKKCDAKCFHVWRWNGPASQVMPPIGTKCECGLLGAGEKWPKTSSK